MAQYMNQFGVVKARAHLSFGTGVFCTGGVSPCVFGETPGNFRANMGYGGTVEYSDGKFGVNIEYDEYESYCVIFFYLAAERSSLHSNLPISKSAE